MKTWELFSHQYTNYVMYCTSLNIKNKILWLDSICPLKTEAPYQYGNISSKYTIYNKENCIIMERRNSRHYTSLLKCSNGGKERVNRYFFEFLHLCACVSYTRTQVHVCICVYVCMYAPPDMNCVYTYASM